jgi:transcription-repair coupling factor (superfamily II helicase)
MYKRLAEVRSLEQVEEVRSELVDRYGTLPAPVENLLAVAALRVKARVAKLTDVNGQGSFIRFSPVTVADSKRVRLDRLYPGSVVKSAVRSILVPRPMSRAVGGEQVRDVAVLDWAGRVIDDIIAESPAS